MVNAHGINMEWTLDSTCTKRDSIKNSVLTRSMMTGGWCDQLTKIQYSTILKI